MNQQRIEGSLMQLKGRLREAWGKFSDDDYQVVTGRREQRLGIRQRRYAMAKAAADREIERWRGA